MARNYGKRTRRYAVGGIVPKQADDDDESYDKLVEGYKKERELEFLENREKVLDRRPGDTGDVDVSPEDYLIPEDRDI